MSLESENNLGPLQAGQTVVVVGGGPAGTGCAIMLRHLAIGKGMPLRVMLFEDKDFSVQQNVCVGVLSPPFQHLLGQLQLSLPTGIVQRQIKGYTLHSNRQSVFLAEKSDGGQPTVVADRGDLDSFLLESVGQAGGSVIKETVVDFQTSPDEVLVVGSGGTKIAADVLVGAFGLDRDSLNIFQARVPGFRPPDTIKSILTEIPVDQRTVTARMQDTIHALLVDDVPGIEFGAFTPKRDRITVNIAGENVDDEDLDAFLKLPWSRKLIPEATAKEPRLYNIFPSKPARNFYRDRVVTIGNTAGLLRPLKGKGINTGLITGIEAARTMIEVGISNAAFDEFYRRCHALTSEFTYGVFLRRLYHLSLKLNVMDPVLALAQHEPLLYRAFYDMISGEGSYKDIIQRSARPSLAAKIVMAIARYQVLRR